jgi:hypothetical protein
VENSILVEIKMRKIIGNEIAVYLKTGEKGEPDIVGLLIDVSEDSVFIQSDMLYIIPRDNVNYYTTDIIPSEDRIIPATQESNNVSVQTQQNNMATSLKVFVDNILAADIPVPPTFKLDQWNEDILRKIMSSQEVQSFLVGKVQKNIEYVPGVVYINTITDQQFVMENTNVDSQTEFSMGGNPSTHFVNPSQMVTRLQNYSNRGNQNGNKTT